MSRHIDADELIEFFDSYPDHIEFDVEDIKSIINEQDTADVVEVVRCKDCKKYNTDDCMMIHGKKMNRNLFDDDFCSAGERR